MDYAIFRRSFKEYGIATIPADLPVDEQHVLIDYLREKKPTERVDATIAWLAHREIERIRNQGYIPSELLTSTTKRYPYKEKVKCDSPHPSK